MSLYVWHVKIRYRIRSAMNFELSNRLPNIWKKIYIYKLSSSRPLSTIRLPTEIIGASLEYLLQSRAEGTHAEEQVEGELICFPYNGWCQEISYAMAIYKSR